MPKVAQMQPIPIVIIRWYQSKLVSVVSEWQRITVSMLDTGIIEDVNRQFRIDDALSEFNSIMVDLQSSFNATMPSVADYAEQAYGRTDLVHKTRWKQIVQETYGISPFLYEQWQSGFIRAFVDDNVALMKNLSEDTAKKISQNVIGGARSGIRASEIAKNIKNDFKVSKTRARLIARDQVSKLYGQLNMHRQSDAGISRYIWSTSDDDRVRKTHGENDDKIMQWKNSNVELSNGRWVTRTGYKGIPGQDIQCRCVALAVMPVEYQPFS